MSGQPSPTRADAEASPATLWLVSTPIGNLGDLAPRAIEVLAEAGLVACEDTRRTAKLLNHAGIRVERLAVANEHTEFGLIEEMLGVLGSGLDVAVVSDAGTPGISDPGERLVAAAIDAGFSVSAVPGPTAAIMALTVSGLPTDRFSFEGFLPRKGVERQARLAQVATDERTVVLYEAPHRVERTMADLIDVCGPDRPAAVCRELTKVYETVLRGPLGSIDLGEPRGEYVIVLGGAPTAVIEFSDDDIAAALAAEIDGGCTRRDAIAAVARRYQVPKNRVYDILHGTADVD